MSTRAPPEEPGRRRPHHHVKLLLGDALVPHAHDERLEAVGVARASRLAEIRSQHPMLCPDGLDPRGAHSDITVDALQNRPLLDHLLHILDARARVRHQHAAHSCLPGGWEDLENLVRRNVSGRQHQIVVCDKLKDLREFWDERAVPHDRHSRPVCSLAARVGFRIPGGQPHDFSTVAFHPQHRPNGMRIDPADGEVQDDTAKDVDARYFVHDHLRPVRRLRSVVLQHDGTHPRSLRDACRVEVGDRPLANVRPRVGMQIDDAAQNRVTVLRPEHLDRRSLLTHDLAREAAHHNRGGQSHSAQPTPTRSPLTTNVMRSPGP